MGDDAGTPAVQTPADAENARKAEDLKKACDEAFNYPPAATSCSDAVWYVVHKLINPKEPQRNANGWIDYLTLRDALHQRADPYKMFEAASDDWHEVTADEGWKLANEGKVVIGGKKDTPNGHVIVIYPGTRIGGGGYLYDYTNKITGKVEQLTMRPHGMLPRALSRSMGQWPGGVSKGDKSIYDPWGRDAAFVLVKFWSMDKP